VADSPPFVSPALAYGGAFWYNDGMKEVDVLGTLLDKYSNGEMIHYATAQLNAVANALRQDSSPENMLKQMGAIMRIAEYFKAIDEKMNNKPKNNATVA
jgi:hypothetical protein